MKKILYAATSFFTVFAIFIITPLSIMFAHAPETPEELR
ncbi:cyclic lactone autoinducer peptide [Aneurinibacillus aneurinilyticus]|jgi:cyclic lactone autoinducer peptide|nr:cyclic lactone autoinducer peptide [Aneurinibacillus aneurinilyticus]MCI1696613.1 cyclic lactone autoinducer peptide [Aneurinibacillus aneurinilyticus]